MGKYYRPFIKTTNWFLAGLLTLLGFSCCNDNDEDDDIIAYPMYGTRHATYTIKGKVIEHLNEQPVSDVQVVLKYDESFLDYEYLNDTLYTDTKGLFLSSRAAPPIHSIKVITTDIKNDIFLPDTMYVSFEEVEVVGRTYDGGGLAEKEITIYVNKKEE